MKLIFLWVSVLVLCFNAAAAHGTPARQAAQLEEDLENGRLPERSEKALSNLIYRAVDQLEKRGFFYEAQTMVTEWENEYRYTYRSYASKMYLRGAYDIGDHEGWSRKLQEWLKMLESRLGHQLMSVTHLSDLIVFNSSNVCFRPCTFPMDAVPGERIDEYRRHMAEGEHYYGLVPVISFWICAGTTMGAGYAFICSPVELLVARFVAPRLSDFIYRKACES